MVPEHAMNTVGPIKSIGSHWVQWILWVPLVTWVNQITRVPQVPQVPQVPHFPLGPTGSIQVQTRDIYLYGSINSDIDEFRLPAALVLLCFRKESVPIGRSRFPLTQTLKDGGSMQQYAATVNGKEELKFLSSFRQPRRN
jgi:hypothetical protein